MELFIKSELSIKNAEETFSNLYPFLKLQLYKNNALKISKAGEAVNAVNIGSDRTLSQVKKDLKETFGLGAQIYRKSGNVWIETTLTDDWTLERQNNEGKLFSNEGAGRSRIL